MQDSPTGARQDSVAVHSLALDNHGRAVFASDGWDGVSAACGGIAPSLVGARASYLDSLQDFADKGDTVSAQLRRGLGAVLRLELRHYALEYTSPLDPQRSFLLWATPFPVEAGGVLVVNVELIHSQTEKREREQRTARLRMAAQAGGVSVFTLDAQTRNLETEIALSQILGYDAGDLVKYPDWMRVVHPEDMPLLLRTASTVLTSPALRDAEGNTPVPFVELRLLRADGNARWFQIRAKVTRDVAGEPLQVIGTITDITSAKTAENALQATNAQLLDLAGRLITASEQERARIARDLHDDLSQELAHVRLTIDKLEPFLRSGPPAWTLKTVADNLGRLSRTVVRLIDKVRKLSHQMHPAVLESSGLIPALRSLIRDMGPGVAITLDAAELTDPIPPEIALCLYRVTQEALHNVIHHSQSLDALVAIKRQPPSLILSVIDHGDGFDLQAVGAHPGLGLVSIRERVRLVNGTVNIASELGKGTEVRVAIPIPALNTESPAGSKPAE